jgi:hypothetical protein
MLALIFRMLLTQASPKSWSYKNRDNLNHAILILLNWRYAILTHMSVTVVVPTCQ